MLRIRLLKEHPAC